MTSEADYIIAGGGSAGCALANRLSEDPNVQVLLLEAGGSHERFLMKLPVGSSKMIGDPEYDWRYKGEPDPSLNGRQVNWFSGRMLGGGSSINGMVYIRGMRGDYDNWAAQGCTGWAWRDVLPYFKRSEDFREAPLPSHGQGGPLSVQYPLYVHPLAETFMQACGTMGMRRIADYCDGDLDGTFKVLVTQTGGERCSAARAHLGAAAGRKNLTMLTGVLVDRLLLEGRRATGVRAVHNGQQREFRARREVVLAAGALQSPLILMRSGIGPGAHLQSMGIPVLQDSPVGRNMQDHPSVYTFKEVNAVTMNALHNPLRRAWHSLNWLLFRRGWLCTGPVHAMAYARSRAELPQPDIQIQFMPGYDLRNKSANRMGIAIGPKVAVPFGRGELRLRGTAPEDHPLIDFKLLGDERDVRVLIEGSKIVDKIYASPPLAALVQGNIKPDPHPTSDADWEKHIRATGNIAFHPVGTCRMGADADSVVDPELRVRGIEALRVADASIMPVLVGANTNAPSIMIGEKAADLIRRKAAGAPSAGAVAARAEAKDTATVN